jgi:hypothetical protein
MTCIAPILKGYADRATAEIQRHLSGLFGGAIRGYLPQNWVLEVDSEVYTIAVDRAGLCRVLTTAPRSRDVTIRIGHDALKRALTDPQPGGGSRPAFAVTFQSSKGETAFKFLHERFGL